MMHCSQLLWSPQTLGTVTRRALFPPLHGTLPFAMARQDGHTEQRHAGAIFPHGGEKATWNPINTASGGNPTLTNLSLQVSV